MRPDGEPSEDGRRMPCTLCRASTPVGVLNHLGARCRRCFDAYCVAPVPPGKPCPAGKPSVPAASDAAPVELPARVPLPAVVVLDAPPLGAEDEYFGSVGGSAP